MNAKALSMRWNLLCILLPASIAFLFSGCYSCFSTRSPEENQNAQPVLPITPPPAQTPASPLPSVESSPSAQETSATLESPVSDDMQDHNAGTIVFSADIIMKITPGMDYEEVEKILGVPEVVVAGREQKHQVYRWSHKGMSFLGRFENGKLVRKNIISSNSSDEVVDEKTLQFDRSLYDSIQPGMSFDQVFEIIGMDAQPLTGCGFPFP